MHSNPPLPASAKGNTSFEHHNELRDLGNMHEKKMITNVITLQGNIRHRHMKRQSYGAKRLEPQAWTYLKESHHSSARYVSSLLFTQRTRRLREVEEIVHSNK